jgi:hypothetical protein
MLSFLNLLFKKLTGIKPFPDPKKHTSIQPPYKNLKFQVKVGLSQLFRLKNSEAFEANR